MLRDAMRIKDFQRGFCLDLLPLSTTFHRAPCAAETRQAEEVKTLRQLFMKQLLGSGRPNTSVV